MGTSLLIQSRGRAIQQPKAGFDGRRPNQGSEPAFARFEVMGTILSPRRESAGLKPFAGEFLSPKAGVSPQEPKRQRHICPKAEVVQQALVPRHPTDTTLLQKGMGEGVGGQRNLIQDDSPLLGISQTRAKAEQG